MPNKYHLMHYRYLFIFLITLLTSFNGNSAITYNSNEIIVSGTETGSSLRTWLNTYSWLATVTNNDITFNRDLKIAANANFSDENAVYHFPFSYRYEPQSNCTVTLTDVTIHYSGNEKSHSFNSAYNANFTRVSYLQGVTSGRSDFFNNGNYSFNMSNVSFVSYGSSDFLHFQTPDTLYNITIVNKQGGLNFEPGAVNSNETEVIYNLTLDNVTSIIGGSSSLGDFKVYNLDWNASNWNFSQRSVDFHIVNPIKPAGWSSYSGSFSRTKEYYTHDVKLVNTDGDAVNNTKVLLLNNYDYQNLPSYGSEYDQTTNSLGLIEQQEILKINNSLSSSLRNRGDFTLIIADYNKKYQTQSRAFAEPVSDILLVDTDPYITNTNSAAVASYSGITIDHTLKQITVSQSKSLCELYDFIKYDKVANNIGFPDLDNLLVSIVNQQFYISDYKLVLNSGSSLTGCDKFNYIKSDVVSDIGSISDLQIGLEDPNGLYKMIQLTNVQSADVLVKDNISNDTLYYVADYTGGLNIVSQSSSSDVAVMVSRTNYSNWIVGLDLSQNIPVYSFEVNQIEGFVLPGLATSNLQEEEIYLLQKILLKSSAIFKAEQGLSLSQDSIVVSTVSPIVTDYPTQEKQEESLTLLKRILTKVTAINKD